MPAIKETQAQNQPDTKALVIRLLRFAWQFRQRCVIVILLQTLILILTIGSVNFTGLAIDFLRDRLIGTDDARFPFGLKPGPEVDAFTVVLIIGCVIALMAALRFIMEYFNELSRGLLIHVDVVLKLRALVYEKMQRLSFRFFDRNASGTLINRVTTDVQATRAFIDQVVVQVFIMGVSLAVYLAYMLSFHVPLTIACLATTPVMWWASTKFSQRLRPSYRENARLMDELVLNFSESMEGIQTVKSFSLEENRQEAFERGAREVREKRQEIFWITSTFAPAIGFMTQFNLVILLGYGGYLVMIDEFPLGTGLVAFAALLQQFSGQIANLAGVADSIQQSLTGARRVFDVLDSPVEIESPNHPVEIGEIKGEVTFDNVTFQHGDAWPILRGIRFTARPGEIIAIAGATGAGKSQLMGLIPRFYDPQEGSVRLDGHDLRTLSVEKIRRSIGIVFQENFLFSNTVAANIAFGNPNATREQIERAARIACAEEFITELPHGYDTLLSENGANLSGGQRQRLAIARAVLLEPPILLLDDPTAAIDPETEHEILTAIERAIEGRTTFIVAHRVSTLKRADRIIVLDHGQIIQQGTHADLYAQEGLYRLAVNQQAVDPESLALLASQERPSMEGGEA